VPAGGLAAAMAGLPCWTAIAGIADGLLAEEPGPAQPAPVALDEGLLAAWDGAFGWLVLADPLLPAEAGQLAAAVAGRQRLTAGLAERDPDKAVDAQRLALRHTELRQGMSAGLWRLHLLAGAADPEAAARVAGLVCASVSTSGLPYLLTPSAGQPATLPELLDTQPADPGPAGTSAAAAFPVYGSTALLAALAQLPEHEVPGVRLVLRPDFDVTVEQGGADPGDPAPAALRLGTVLDRNASPAGQLSLPTASLNRHMFVCGATGAGKSQTVRALLEAASAAGLPWLVVEPAKSEYRLMGVRLDGVEVVRIRPGEADQVAAGINPLAPAAGPDGQRFPLQTHADLVRALFLASFAADEPFPQVLSAAVTRVYEQAGWDLALGEPAAPGGQPGYPALGDLAAAAERVVTEIGYGREITDNVRGFIRVRLASLRLGTTGRFFEGGHPIDFGRLLDRNVVFEIEDVGDDRDKAFLMGTVLIQLTEHLRLRARSAGPAAAAQAGLRHLSVFEEAHRLLRRPDAAAAGTGAAAHAVEMFAGLLAEIRAYGEGLIIAEQIPAKLIPDAIKNTAVKIVHRLPAADDRETVGATMNLTDAQSRYLVTLPPGQAAVFADGMDFSVLASMPDGTAREAAGPVVTASPGAVVSPRSGTCGADCRAAPCTLRDMRAAQRFLDETPALVLWAELAVLAHLTGWLMPLPATGSDLATRLANSAGTGGSARLLDCAVSHALDAAVACRVSVSRGRVSPAALADHVAAALRRWISDRGRECSFPEPEWLAPAFRWALILDDLKTLDRREPGAARHPLSESWERSCGRPISGETCARQIGVVQRWYDADQRDASRVRGVAFGTVDPSAVERSVDARVSDEEWEQRLSEALREFHDCRWPLDYLQGSTAAATRR
jgi:DNA helicase HerA-like ATPase